MRERIEGVVGLQGVIDVNGRIREPRVTKSLDKVYGLDEQARKTVEAMAFEPATKDGKPVRVLVDIDLMFALSPLPPPPYKAPPPQPGAQNPPPPPPPAPRLGTPEAARLARCEWEQDQAVKAGWDLTNVHLPCEAGVEPPIRTRAVNAAYTPEAMRAKIQGFVKIQAVVDVDGVVREVKVAQSLDRVFGLDEQALKAVRAMTFAPGKFKGQPARVLMYFDMPFALR
jgi:TonB family protein